MKNNSDVLADKSLDDLKKIAVSLGLFPSENFSKEDYINFISKGIEPTIKSYSQKELELMNMEELRNMANELKLKSPYKYKKNDLAALIYQTLQNNDSDAKDDLREKTIIELRKIADKKGIKSSYKYKKSELIDLLRDEDSVFEEELEIPNDEEYEKLLKEDDEFANPEISNLEPEFDENEDEKSANKEEVIGILEVLPDGFGFLRVKNYMPSENDVYVAPSQIRKFRLQTGDMVRGITRENDNDNYNALIYINEVNGLEAYRVGHRPSFENLTPIYPNKRIILETQHDELATRVIDLVCPIGRGQRGLIVSQPKSGKTSLLKKMAQAISKNYDDIHLMVLLIDERPEEVTDMARSVDAEVIYSTFDQAPLNHTKVAEMALERAKRLVEKGEDVVLLMDSLTRLARAYNLITPPSGKTLSGGLDPLSLHKPKRFFGAARNIEGGGSLTIIATALIETGSRMDDIIFEEFKGTGNMEVHLDRKLSEKRIFPAIDIYKSGTRKEDLLLEKEEIDFAYALRRSIIGNSTQEVTEKLLYNLMESKDNKEFLKKIDIDTF